MNFCNVIGMRLGALLLVFAALPVSAQTPSMLDPVTTQISAGYYHACALTTTGGVKCWGDNLSGQLGNNNSTTESDVPVAVVDSTNTPVSGVAVIAAGGDHTCALTTAGAVKCWGDNTFGQLGNASTTDSNVPVDVNGLTSGVAAIAAGGDHTCALTTAGGVKCWGDNPNGELGNNSTTNSDVPVDVNGLASGVVAIAAGGFHSCALTTAGGVKCWGWNGDGQLGNNSITDSGVPVDVTGLTSGVVAIAAGYEHTCALTTAGAVQCWGYNVDGELGNNSTMQSPVPVDVSSLGGGVAAIATSGYHTCALTTGGGVKCWGYNGYGQLGNNTITNSDVPVAVSGLSNDVAAITAGYDHTCALTTAGGVQCWGYNGNGQLGNNTTTQSHVPVDVAGLSSSVAAVAAGGDHTCALTTGGGVQCWGYNSNGELGNNTTTQSPVPVAVVDSTNNAISGVAAITAGEPHTCALTTSGGVQCWGDNFYGELGNNTTTESHVPVAVVDSTNTAISGVAAIVAGGEHTCALTTGGGVQCWGDNTFGELGNNTTTSSSVPVAVVDSTNTPISGVAAIAAGGGHTCALTTGGGVKCWGFNGYGQLGNNTITSSDVSVVVSGLTNGVAAITAGYDHTCALTTGGGVKCWGYNGDGELGNNTTTQSPVPVAVVDSTNTAISGVAAIAAGEDHTCALTTGGGVQCWGGELGNNTATDSPVPVPVVDSANTPISGVAAIAAGDYHTCALTTGGRVKCWGNNDYGELGNNSTTNSLTPASILAGQSLSFSPATTMALGSTLNLGASANAMSIRASRSISSSAATTMSVGSTLDLSATISGVGSVPLVFDTWTPSTCSINGSIVTATAQALCGVRVSRAGGSDGTNGTTATAPQQLRLIQVTPAAPAVPAPMLSTWLLALLGSLLGLVGLTRVTRAA